MRKPRVAVFMVTSGWFRDVGLQAGESDLSAMVEEHAEEVVTRLAEVVEPVRSGVLYSVERAREAGVAAAAQALDAVLVVPLMWCEDQIVRAAINRIPHLAAILWTFSPVAKLPETLSFHEMLSGSGPVASLQLSGMLRREGREYYPVAGHMRDDRAYEHIGVLARGLALRRDLRSMKVGVLPFRCDQMSTTYVDEMGLRARYGVELDYIQVSELVSTAAGASSEDIETVHRSLRAIDAEITIPHKDLVEGMRYAASLWSIASTRNLSAVAMNDVIPEMHDAAGLRPCLFHPGLSRDRIPVSMEADVAAALAMRILWELTGESPLYTEVLSIDFEANALLLGHAGFHDPEHRDPDGPLQIVPDVEYMETDPTPGAAIYFKYRPGAVTVVNSVWAHEGLSWTAFEGESLPGPAKLEGNAHLVCEPTSLRVSSLVERAIERGVSQHWIVVPGHRARELSTTCRVLGVSFEKLERS